jgi:hypothetical protein
MKRFLNWLKTLFSPPIITAGPIKNPPYIEYSNDIAIPIPGNADDTWLYCFPIKGTYANMLETVNQRLNFSPLNKSVRFFPLSETMMMTVSDIRKGYSTSPNYDKYGYLEEKALQIFMPLVECTLNADNEWVAQRIFFFLPYILVDQPLNVVIGREELGFVKSFAKFAMPNSPELADKFQIDGYGFKNFNKENPEFGAYHNWINIKKTNGDITEGKWENQSEAWASIKKHIQPKTDNSDFHIGLPFVIHELEDLFHGTLPMVFLKQFRDIAIPQNACYQAITQGNGILESFHGGWFLGGEYEINIEDFASYPIKSDLGLASKITVEHPFWVHCDLKFDTGKVLWNANN